MALAGLMNGSIVNGMNVDGSGSGNGGSNGDGIVEVKVDHKDINRHQFPSDFIFGVAASAYQFEGCYAECGKGPSIWDCFCLRHPEKIVGGDNGCKACDCYNRMKGDVLTLKKMGIKAYRFSISWPRILPGGKISMGVNHEGIKFYSDLIDELLANGIEPYVTLFHWDTPNALEEEYMGFLSPKIVDDFVNFAELCFWEFGDRVKNWITLNEPWSYAVGGYVMGSLAPGRGGIRPVTYDKDQGVGISSAFAPGVGVPLSRVSLGQANLGNNEGLVRPDPFAKSQSTTTDSSATGQKSEPMEGDSGTEPYIVAHNLLLAHAHVYHKYKNSFQASQKGRVGITLVSQFFEPLDPNHDQQGVSNALDFMLGWFLAPLTRGEYPESMRVYVQERLPVFTPRESVLLIDSYDFMGINYYTTHYAKYLPDPPTIGVYPSYTTDAHYKDETKRHGVPIGRQAGSSWLYVYPKGIYSLLTYMHKEYRITKDIYITENGVDEKSDCSKTMAECLKDPNRIDYHCAHLYYVLKAMAEGVPVKAYFAWSFMDNFEWSEGYSVRFGMIFVDFKNGLIRYPKQSAIWYKTFLALEQEDVSPLPVAKKRVRGNQVIEIAKKTKI